MLRLPTTFIIWLLSLFTPFAADTGAGNAHWAFQPVIRPRLPDVIGEAGNPIDRFVRQQLEARGIDLSGASTHPGKLTESRCCGASRWIRLGCRQSPSKSPCFSPTLVTTRTNDWLTGYLHHLNSEKGGPGIGWMALGTPIAKDTNRTFSQYVEIPAIRNQFHQSRRAI